MNTKAMNCAYEAEQPVNNYKTEGDAIINCMKDERSGAMYSYHFFFDTEETDERGRRKKKLCQIAPMRSKLVYDLKRYYGVSVNPDYVSTTLYEKVWCNGSFETLSRFEGKSSFYVWLKEVAKNAVLASLVEEGWLNKTGKKTAGNTRLALLSQSPAKCKLVIDEMMGNSQYHDLLIAIYVDRLPAGKIMKRLHFEDAEALKKAKEAGVEKLKDALLRSTDFAEENIVRSKAMQPEMVSTDFVADLSEWAKGKTGVNPLSDVFGTNLTDEEVRLKTVEFLYDFSAKLWPEKVGEDIVVNEDDDEKTRKKKEKQIKKKEEKEKTNKRDCYIWRRRFIQNVYAEDVAMEVGHDHKWLDTRYSRLNAVFKKAIRKWWEAHA